MITRDVADSKDEMGGDITRKKSLSVFFVVALSIAMMPVMTALSAGVPDGIGGTAADNPLTTSYTLSGKLDVIVVGLAFDYVNDPIGVFTVTGIPAGATIEKALVYLQEWEYSAGELASCVFAGNGLGNIAPFTNDPGGIYDLAIYRWDVTIFVAGDGSYPFTAMGLEQVYGAALVVVYCHSSNPDCEVRINDGAESMMSTTATTDFYGVAAGSGELIIFTQAGDSPPSDETIAFNGATVGGPIEGNLGPHASIFPIPVTTLDGVNTASITTGTDWIGWHLAILVSEPSTFVIPEVPLGTVTALLLSLGALVMFRKRPAIRI